MIKKLCFIIGYPGVGKTTLIENIFKSGVGIEYKCKILISSKILFDFVGEEKVMKTNGNCLDFDGYCEHLTARIDEEFKYNDIIIVDGFPRSAKQIEFAKIMIENYNGTIFLADLNKKEIIQRLNSRTICSQCKSPSSCDCQGSRIKRKDDNIEVINNRLKAQDKIIGEIEKLGGNLTRLNFNGLNEQSVYELFLSELHKKLYQ